MAVTRIAHERAECEHGMVLSQCRCLGLSPKPVRVVRPCPHPVEHLGRTVVHPEPSAAVVGDGLGQVPAELAGSAAEPVEEGRRHWLPTLVWLGRTAATGLSDFAPVFTTQEDASAWASKDPRRVIWSVAIPVDTEVFSVEVVPASTRLNRVRPW